MRAPMLLGLLPLAALLAGCQCSPLGVEATRFLCSSSGDCLEGFECRDLGDGLECVRLGTDAGSVDAGLPDAGAFDAGAVDAGDVDAGDVDAGDVDAGDVDAGDVDAGGVDAGGVDAGGVDAGGVDAGGVDAGGVDAGPDAGNPNPPTQLRFTTMPQTVAVAACSQLIGLETLNAGGAVTAVAAGTGVALASAPPGVVFYGTSNCTGPQVSTLTIGAGLSSTSFSVSAPFAGAFTLGASSPPLTGASQALVAQNAPTSLVFTSTPPNPVRGGTCLSATVEARRGATATPVISTTTVGLSVAPSGGVRFYSDAACATTTTTALIAGGASTATFFLKPLTGGSNLVSAAAPFGTAQQTLVTTPIVRRGQCSFPASSVLPDGGIVTELVATCAVSPALTDLTASLLWSQATANVAGGELGAAEVRCRLATTSSLSCRRAQDASAADVHFQVAEVPQGLLVQRATSTGCPATISLTTPVTASRSFVLKTVASSTLYLDDEDAMIAALLDPVTVSLSPTTCAGSDVQVADWTGLTVTRGEVDGGLPLGVASVTVSGLPPASTNRALIFQPGTSLNASRPVCSAMIRGAMPSSSSLSFTRSAGDGGCLTPAMDKLYYERIDFGTKGVVREYTTTFAPGTAARAVTITPVDPTRTVVFASSQIAGGQGAGETDHDGPVLFNEGAFQLVLTNATTVTVTRVESTSTALVTFSVAELVP